MYVYRFIAASYAPTPQQKRVKFTQTEFSNLQFTAQQKSKAAKKKTIIKAISMRRVEERGSSSHPLFHTHTHIYTHYLHTYARCLLGKVRKNPLQAGSCVLWRVSSFVAPVACCGPQIDSLQCLSCPSVYK